MVFFAKLRCMAARAVVIAAVLVPYAPGSACCAVPRIVCGCCTPSDCGVSCGCCQTRYHSCPSVSRIIDSRRIADAAARQARAPMSYPVADPASRVSPQQARFARVPEAAWSRCVRLCRLTL